MTGIALNLLSAMRAGEFDFRHGLSRSTGIATSILNAAIVSFHPVLGNLNAKMKIETLKTALGGMEKDGNYGL